MQSIHIGRHGQFTGSGKDRGLLQNIRPYPKEFPSFAIGIPTLNRWDLLRPALWKYLQDFPHTHIYVLDNGNQQKEIERPTIHYINQKQNIGVAASWNILCDRIYGDNNKFALIMNDDIYLGRNEYQIGNLLHYQKGSFFVTPKDWCVFVAPVQTYQEVGRFDENFMAYCEDRDYQYRLKLAGKGITRWEMIMPLIYRNNSTSDKNPDVLKWAQQSQEYYIRKWGGEPGAEIFSLPFGKRK
jgi:GT2 family glycosyltransferase